MYGYYWYCGYILAIFFLSGVHGTGQGPPCFALSCGGWVCHCRAGYDYVRKKGTCPISSEHGDLACPMRSCEPGWSGPGCQIGNIANSKQATFSSYDEGPPPSAHCAAINPCKTTRELRPWVRVDLGSKHVVRSVNIRFSKKDINCCRRNRIWNLEVRVGNSTDISENPICKKLKRVALDRDWKKDCVRSMVGRYVSVQVTNDQPVILWLLDVQATGFMYRDIDTCEIPESFGCMERSQCNENVPHNTVDYMSGFCPGGCNADRVGNSCEKQFKYGYTPIVMHRTRHQLSVWWYKVFTNSPDSGIRRYELEYLLLCRKLGTYDWVIAQSPQLKSDVKVFQNITDLETNTGYEIAIKLRKVEANLTSSLLSPITEAYTGCDEPTVGPQITHMSQERMVSNNSTKFRIFPTYQLLNSSQLRCNDTEGVAYELYYQLADSADSEWKAFRASYPPDMVPYTKYRMKVGAKNKGNAEYVSGESIEVVPGNGVTDLTAMNTSFGRVNVTWKIPNTLKHLKFEFHGRYRLRGRRNSPAIWAYQWQISPFPTNNTDMEFVELSPYSTYDVGILAVQLGEGAILRRQYVTTSILTMQSEPVGSPEPPVVIPEKVALKDFQETTYAGVTFSHIPRKNQNGIFGGFYYTLYEKSTGEVVRENITMHTSISLKGLKPYTTYVVSYAWTNEAGKSEQSNNTEFTTDEAALLKINITLKQVSLKTRSGSHLLVEYDQQEGGGKVLKYAAQCGETTGENVQPLRSSKSSWNMKSFDADENIVYDLKPSTWYGCQGAALSKKGWSRPSPYVYVYIN